MFVTTNTRQQVRNLKSTCKFKKYLPLFLILFFLWGCKTTSGVSRKKFTPEEPFIIEEQLNFHTIDEPYKYIFLRLYNPEYSNPLYYANLLKNLIAATETTGFTASHAAIGFSLEDKFYGLTSSGENGVKPESCSNIADNAYMKTCNPDKSAQLTMAIKVRESEYDEIQKFVLESQDNTNLKYDISINFPIASISIKRKFFSTKNGKKFGNFKYPKTDVTVENDPEDKFVCCTFIAYCLVKYIPEYREWFEEHEIDYHMLTVTDLIYLPNVVKLFDSTWSDYTIAAETFVDQNPEFLPYLNK